MNTSDIEALNTERCQALLEQYKDSDPQEFALKFNNQDQSVPVRALTEQLACRKKAVRKLPQLSRNSLLYESRALEQCSSEVTARYKSKLLHGARLIDCTGGLGIDTLFLSSTFTEVVYCEKDLGLSMLFEINSRQLKKNNIRIYHGDCIEILTASADNTFDWLYIDPSRRDTHTRYVDFSQCEPDILQHLDLLYAKAANICIKASPLFDITEAFRQVRGLHSACVVSVDGECKELLLLCRRDHTAELPRQVKAVVCTSAEKPEVEYCINPESTPSRLCASSCGRYFYEPDAAIIKARCCEALSQEYCLPFVNNSVAYMTSDRLIIDFPGRKFEVVSALDWQRKEVIVYLKKHNIHQANVARREFPMTPQQIKDKLHISDGGQEYLFFTRDAADQPLMVHCRKPETGIL